MDEPSEASETTVDALASEFCQHGSPMDSNDGCSDENKPAVNPRQILGALEIVERDSVAIAESFNSLFSSLRLALSEVTGSSVEHMHCFLDAAGHLQESRKENYFSDLELLLNTLDAATNGNHFINSCLRLNQEMKGIENLAMQFAILASSLHSWSLRVARIIFWFVLLITFCRKILKRSVDALDSSINQILRFS